MSSPALGFSAEDERAVPKCAVTGDGGAHLANLCPPPHPTLGTPFPQSPVGRARGGLLDEEMPRD